MDKTKTNGSRVKEAKRLMHISISLVDLWPIGWDVCKFHLKCSFIFKSQGQWNAASILKLDLKSLVLILTWSKRDAKKSISEKDGCLTIKFSDLKTNQLEELKKNKILQRDGISALLILYLHSDVDRSITEWSLTTGYAYFVTVLIAGPPLGYLQDGCTI